MRPAVTSIKIQAFDHDDDSFPKFMLKSAEKMKHSARKGSV
jgi:hypothetical protein